MTHRLIALASAGIASATLLVASAMPASAHAIVDLSGAPAYAGKTSVMTLEVQHGCVQNQACIDKVAAYFNKKFGKVTPQSVTGWSGKVSRTSEGRKVVWTLQGDVPAFNAPTFFPMSITWPAKSGVYGVPVRQWCDGETNVWDVPDGPATANKPSPPLYPLPQIKVLPAP